MDTYTFEKSYLERLKEAEAVLSWDGAVKPASQVRSEWKSYVELQIEPTGWQAMWKIPRVICENLMVRYPTIVFGYVDQITFDELKAEFVVTAVQDQDVHLPERNEVSLIDLWPTVQQENSALNVDTTADCIDRLRFFYNHVWMPWDKDYDDDRDWVQLHLQARIQLACDLSKNRLPKSLAIHIKTLMMEARYIQQRLDFLELSLSDTEDESVDEAVELGNNITDPSRKLPKGTSSNPNNLNKSLLPVTDLMCLHLRLAIIRSEFEILENPEMRRAYNETQNKGLKRNVMQRSVYGSGGQLMELAKRASMCHLVTAPYELQTQINLLNYAKELVEPHKQVQIGNNLQDVLNVCETNDDILLSPGVHTIKFLQHLNEGGSITGLFKKSVISETQDLSILPVICSSDEDSTLMVVNGDYTLSQVVLDCQSVRRGILLRSGTLTMRNCFLLGDGSSSTQEAIVCMPQATVKLESCVLENFSIGISLLAKSNAVLRKISIKKCNIGLELLDKSISLEMLDNNCVFDSCKVGILADDIYLPKSTDKSRVLQQFDELQRFNEAAWLGNCNFQNCVCNIRVNNHLEQLLSKRTHSHLLREELDIENKENTNT